MRLFMPLWLRAHQLGYLYRAIVLLLYASFKNSSYAKNSYT
jgi:hypothetical protein